MILFVVGVAVGIVIVCAWAEIDMRWSERKLGRWSDLDAYLADHIDLAELERRVWEAINR